MEVRNNYIFLKGPDLTLIKDGDFCDVAMCEKYTFMEEILYFCRDNVLYSIEADMIKEEATFTNMKDVVAGEGRCGNFRVFTLDDGALKVFDPISKDIIELLDGLEDAISLAKEGCDIYIKCQERVIIFNLQEFKSKEYKIKL